MKQRIDNILFKKYDKLGIWTEFRFYCLRTKIQPKKLKYLKVRQR